MKADILADSGERVSLMEPLLIGDRSRHRGPLMDLVLDLTQKSAGFRRSLPSSLLAPLADLVRAMNCYYSNLIEGHDTHPVDIERALRNDFSQDIRKRDLQLEAKAHIAVQHWIDTGGLKGGQAIKAEGISEIHRRFCELLPEHLLWVEDPVTKERLRLAPGEFRKRNVRVGNHIAISPGALPRFLERFEQVYGNLGKADWIISSAAAHHRLLWMHPFMDGNGRVARLMSHAMLLDILDTGAVWSVARGLARNGQLRFRASKRSGRARELKRRGARRFYPVFPHGLHRSSHFHGQPHAAGPLAHAHPALGRGGNQAGPAPRQIEQHP